MINNDVKELDSLEYIFLVDIDVYFPKNSLVMREYLFSAFWLFVFVALDKVKCSKNTFSLSVHAFLETMNKIMLPLFIQEAKWLRSIY